MKGTNQKSGLIRHPGRQKETNQFSGFYRQSGRHKETNMNFCYIRQPGKHKEMNRNSGFIRQPERHKDTDQSTCFFRMPGREKVLSELESPLRFQILAERQKGRTLFVKGDPCYIFTWPYYTSMYETDKEVMSIRPSVHSSNSSTDKATIISIIKFLSYSYRIHSNNHLECPLNLIRARSTLCYLSKIEVPRDVRNS